MEATAYCEEEAALAALVGPKTSTAQDALYAPICRQARRNWSAGGKFSTGTVPGDCGQRLIRDFGRFGRVFATTCGESGGA